MDSLTERSGIDPPRGRVIAIRQAQVVDYPSTAESLLPLSEASVVQMKPGPAPSNLMIFSSEKVSLLELQHHVASVGVVVNQADHFGFMWWDGRDGCRINGEPAHPTEIYTQGEQDGFHAAGGARRTTGISVRRNDLIETVAALSGVGPEDVLLKHTALKLTPDEAARFRTGVDTLMRNAIETRRGGLNSVDPSEGLFALLVDAHIRSRHQRRSEYRARQPEQIVRKAEERYFASRGASVSLADLCAAARVSQSGLYRAFHTVCGEPPLAYLYKRRLTDARKALIRSPARRGAVKSAALAAGLTELGRFSVEYRNLFGESPSATLNRSVEL